MDKEKMEECFKIFIQNIRPQPNMGELQILALYTKFIIDGNINEIPNGNVP